MKYHVAVQLVRFYHDRCERAGEGNYHRAQGGDTSIKAKDRIVLMLFHSEPCPGMTIFGLN